MIKEKKYLHLWNNLALQTDLAQCSSLLQKLNAHSGKNTLAFFGGVE